MKRVLHMLFGNYHYWKVYAVELPYPRPELPEAITIRELTLEDLKTVESDTKIYADAYLGDQALGFGLFVDGQLATLQGVWWGKRYIRERNGRSWRIREWEAKTNNLYTINKYRGNGYALLLKRYTLAELGERGFSKAYARIWHSHRASIRVSKRAGMKLVGAYIEINPIGRRVTLRIPFRFKF